MGKHPLGLLINYLKLAAHTWVSGKALPETFRLRTNWLYYGIQELQRGHEQHLGQWSLLIFKATASIRMELYEGLILPGKSSRMGNIIQPMKL